MLEVAEITYCRVMAPVEASCDVSFKVEVLRTLVVFRVFAKLLTTVA